MTSTINRDSFKEVNEDRGTGMMLGATASNHKGQGRAGGQQEKCQGQVVNNLLCQTKELGLWGRGVGCGWAEGKGKEPVKDGNRR